MNVKEWLYLLFLCVVLSIVAAILWVYTIPPSVPRIPGLDPAPAPYIWSRISPNPDFTCLIAESQYNAHSIAMWCERIAQ